MNHLLDVLPMLIREKGFYIGYAACYMIWYVVRYAIRYVGTL